MRSIETRQDFARLLKQQFEELPARPTKTVQLLQKDEKEAGENIYFLRTTIDVLIPIADAENVRLSVDFYMDSELREQLKDPFSTEPITEAKAKQWIQSQ